MKNILKFAIIITILISVFGCSKSNNTTNNQLDVVDTYDKLTPNKMNGLSYSLTITGAIGFFEQNHNYFIEFNESQDIYEIYEIEVNENGMNSTEHELKSTGSYEYSEFGRFVMLTIQDSIFGYGTIQFEFIEKGIGKYTIFAGNNGTDIQFADFKLINI